MEFLDLSKLTPKQREQIETIISSNACGDVTPPVNNSIKEEYLSGIKNIKKSEEYDSMDYDTKPEFNTAINSQSTPIFERRRDRRLTEANKVTYQLLEVIHESGSVSNFWDKVRNVVESKKNISLSEVDDKIDPNLLK
jgi:hypothetical protein